VDKTYVSLTQGSSQDFLQPCNNEKTLWSCGQGISFSDKRILDFL
jgi:hypothetical protein